MVRFKFGTKAEYKQLLVPDTNTLYFITDTGEIYRGDVNFGTGGGGGSSADTMGEQEFVDYIMENEIADPVFLEENTIVLADDNTILTY